MPEVPRERLDHLLVKTSRTFALSIPVLPEPTRRDVTVAYLLFRIADTLEDATRWTRRRKLSELQQLARLLEDPATDPAAQLAASWVEDPPLAHDGYVELLSELPTVLRAHLESSPEARRLVASHTCRTIERMAAFVEREQDGVLRLGGLEELRAYCYAVAGIVGEMLTELFLLGRDELVSIATELRRDAATFGEALQLVNILKDSATDASEGRNYLPAGVDRAEVLALARRDLDIAARYCGRLFEAGAPRGVVEFTLLPVLLARATLDTVERDGPGSKITRTQVQQIVQRMNHALNAGDLSGIRAATDAAQTAQRA